MTVTTPGAAGAALRAALGPDRVRPAGARADRLGAQWTVLATDTADVVATMRVSAEQGLAVVPTGNGTKLDWAGAPERVDVLLDMSGVHGIVEHAAGDLVVRARAGTMLDEVNEAVRQSGQQLAIDHSLPAATLGGVVATGESGPGRHAFGGVRDLLIGVTVVCADGTVTTSGGKVVKNVAGYDLGKLYTGSYGTLGVITELIFRLHPVCGEHCWTRTAVDTPERAAELVRELRRTQAVPTAVEIDQPDVSGQITVCAEFEGSTGVTRERTVDLANSLGVATAVSDAPPEWWGRYPFDPSSGIGIRVGARPAELAVLLKTVRAAAAEYELDVGLRGAAGLGVVHIGLSGAADPDRMAGFVARLRAACTYAVVVRAPRPIREVEDVWGPIEPAKLALLRRIKRQFDPDRQLSPGRFVGGI